MNPVKILRSIPWRTRCLLSSKHELCLFRMSAGEVVYYPIRSQIGYALFRGTFEASELAFVRATLKPGETFIDIGANAGIFSIRAAGLVGSEGKVLAYEPAAFENALLCLNLRTNQLRNVTVELKGVSDREGETDFVISDDGAMNSLRRTEHPNQQPVSATRIQTTTLTAILDRPDIGKLSLIKIDTEGAERQILLSALERLRTIPGIRVLFESQDANNRGFGYRATDFLAEIRKTGARVSQLNSQGEAVFLDVHNPNIGESIYNFVLHFDAPS
jgi:FkbM family methyltransferase